MAPSSPGLTRHEWGADDGPRWLQLGPGGGAQQNPGTSSYKAHGGGGCVPHLGLPPAPQNLLGPLNYPTATMEVRGQWKIVFSMCWNKITFIYQHSRQKDHYKNSDKCHFAWNVTVLLTWLKAFTKAARPSVSSDCLSFLSPHTLCSVHSGFFAVPWIFFFLPHLETCGSLGWEDLREKGKATHSYSGPENSMVSIVHGVAKSQTRLSNFHFHWGMWDLSSPTRDWNCALCPESLNHWSTREVCLAVPWMCQPHSGLGTFALVLCANWNTLPSDIHSQVTSAEVYSDHRLFCRHIWLPSSCSSFLFDVGFHFVIYKTVGLSSLFLIPTLSSRR